MSTLSPPISTPDRSDAELCAAALARDRGAFAEIVDRYQNLVCAIAYSALGDLGRSEDLAQEAFLVAWKNLATLREPAKLRHWLCGIVRMLARNERRRQGRDVVATAHAIESQDVAALDATAPPLEAVIRHEEIALLGQVLARLSPKYREPLVLYYRGEQSVAEVAAQLGLNEDAVKQRLARGRKQLRAEVAAMVETSLRATRPGRAFTLAVLASLPGIGASTAVAGTLGATSHAAPLAAKAVAASSSAAVWGPLLGILGAAFGFWAGDQATRYPRERKSYRRMVRGLVVVLAVFMVPFGLMWIGVWNPVQQLGPVGYSVALISWIFGLIGVCHAWNWWMSRQWEQVVAEEIAAGAPPLPMTPVRSFLSKWEGRRWTSRWTLFGLPLIDIQCSDPDLRNAGATFPFWRRRVARGWIAVGDRAYGFIAVGNIAVGGIALGGVSVGVIAIGALAIGGFGLGGAAIAGVALAGAAIGSLACGGLAAGWLATGGGAFAWRAANGGLAVAQDFAVGGHAVATHANDAAAKAFVAESWFLSGVQSVLQNPTWFVVPYIALSLVLYVALLLLSYRAKSVSGAGHANR